MRSTFILSLCVILFASCKRDQKQWETNILTPVFQANLGLDDLLDDSLLITNTDKSYHLNYNYIYDIDSVGNYLDVPDTLDKVRITLDKLVLADKTYIDTFTLRQMDPTTGLLDGLTLPFEAQRIENPQGEQEIDVSEEFFQTAKFNKGFLDLTIHNDLPVYVENIIFKLANKANGEVVAQDTFSDIAPNSSAQKAIDLAGKTVDGVMVGSILLVETRASNGPVLIDADKGVRLELAVRDLEPEFATAIFPEQTLVEDKQEVVYRFGGPQITEIKARSGLVRMKISSTIEEEIIIDYSFPHSGEGGDFNKPFIRQYRVPPAKPGQVQVIEGDFPIDGFVMQYKGKDPSEPPFFNTVYSELVARTVYSGEVRNLSLDDFVEIEFGLVEVKPEYAFGDFGYKKFNVSESRDIPIFKNIRGDVNFEDVQMVLTIENAFGIEALTTVNHIRGINTRSNAEVSLTHPTLIGNDVLIRRASNPPLSARTYPFFFDESTSNIKSFFNILPDKIETDMQLISRPNGSQDYTDFVKDESYLRASLSLDVPVQFSATNLSLVQKQRFDFNALAQSDRIKSGEFKLEVENDFPYDLSLQMEFLTEDDSVLVQLFGDGQKVEAADVDPGTGKTTGGRNSYLVAQIDEATMDLLRDAVKIRIRATLDSPEGRSTKIFSDYKLKTKLIADFIYEQAI